MSKRKTITVTGQGATTVQPDLAVIDIGVRVSGSAARPVLAETNEAAAALVRALKALGVADDDLTTAGISLYPQYDQDRRISGFEASNSLRVTIRDVERAGEIIDGAAEAAGDAITIGGISFSVADPESMMAAARTAAVANARSRAAEYAAAAGVEVGELISISESVVGGPMPMYRKFAADAMSVQAGSTELSASVTVVFALG